MSHRALSLFLSLPPSYSLSSPLSLSISVVSFLPPWLCAVFPCTFHSLLGSLLQTIFIHSTYIHFKVIRHVKLFLSLQLRRVYDRCHKTKFNILLQFQLLLLLLYFNNSSFFFVLYIYIFCSFAFGSVGFTR